MNATDMHARRASMTRLAQAAAASALCAALAVPAPAAAQTLVNITDGAVQGQLNDGTREFLGIPYAAPPVGSLRFSPPAPAIPWGGTLDATEYPPGCAQLPVLTNSNTRIENEDCLYLNVWTPDPAPSEPLPVMIWIHGGSNTSGSTANFVPFPPYEALRLYDGHFMTRDQNVVVVTINYRLNVFGFFGMPEIAGEDPGHPFAGNQGLLDQRAAMLWVQDNIAAFGGDPDNVTIYGESAGSFDVCAHVVSPMSRGLFHRAISQSGGCSVGVQTEQDASAAADIIAEALGCDIAPDRLACLRGKTTAELLDAGPLVGLVTEGTSLGISIDGGFLTENPRETLLDRELPKVPYILGANADEGTLFFIGTPELTAEEYSATLVDRFGAFAPEVEALYPATRFGTPRDTLIRVVGDGTLVCSTHDVARRYAQSMHRTYLYTFTRVPPLAFISFLDLGAFHGLEIGYVFGSVPPPSFDDGVLGQQIQTYWASFAAKGKPKAKNTPRWPKFRNRYYKALRLNISPAITPDYRRAECDFWSTYYETL